MNPIRRHIASVDGLMTQVASIIKTRGWNHDLSKLQEPEYTAFLESQKTFLKLPYPSPEYDEAKERLDEVIQHHYSLNSHHPEHYGQSSQLEKTYLESIEKHRPQINQLNMDLSYYGAGFQVKPVPYEYQGGINGMSLFDIIEMLMDWKVASGEHNSTIQNSLEHGKERFGIDEQLYSILVNTVKEMGWE